MSVQTTLGLEQSQKNGRCQRGTPASLGCQSRSKYRKYAPPNFGGRSKPYMRLSCMANISDSTCLDARLKCCHDRNEKIIFSGGSPMSRSVRISHSVPSE